jgi:hypothetical protein
MQPKLVVGDLGREAVVRGAIAIGIGIGIAREITFTTRAERATR